jgi:hypothetical protein
MMPLTGQTPITSMKAICMGTVHRLSLTVRTRARRTFAHHTFQPGFSR